MKFEIKRATKKSARLRMALIGPSGSGKTYSALAIASGLGSRVVVIDTERGSASKYAGDFGFDVLELETFEPRTYVEALRACCEAGADVVVVDSLSHAWIGRGGALEQVDRAAKRQGGNSFGAWRDVTPQHNDLVDAMLRTDAHLIVTMRAKTEFVQERDERTGRTVVRKIGLAPVQRDGLEYEFDVVCDVNHEHEAVVTKSRCSALADKVIPQPGAELARTLKAWLTDGATPASAVRPAEPRAPEARTSNDAAPARAVSDSAFYDELADVKLPGDAVALWVKHRAELAMLPSSDREAAWKAICARVETVGKFSNGKVWLKRALAEHDAQPAVLGSITDAPDVASVCERLVGALASYPAMEAALWTTALGAAGRFGVDETTLRRMIDERRDPQGPPDGPRGGGAPRTSASNTNARGSAAGAGAVQGEVMTVAEDILSRHGNNIFALPGSVAKHADELTPEDAEKIAAHVAKRWGVGTSKEAQERALAKARLDVASWIARGRSQQQARAAS